MKILKFALPRSLNPRISNALFLALKIKGDKKIAFKVAIPVIFALIFFSPLAGVTQHASALLIAAQITSAKSDGSNVANGALITLPQGKSSTAVTFEFRAFDNDNHVVELRCSFDGINYLKSNCATQSAESQSAFAGPDGVVRTYYVKTGTAAKQITASPAPKTIFFGVKGFNDNGSLSPAATFTFKVRLATNAGIGGGSGGPLTDPPATTLVNKVTVKFDSITIKDDHDLDYTVPSFRGSPTSTTAVSGEWQLIAYVQGKGIGLLDNAQVYSGKTYKFKPGTEITVNLKESVPLSIFTVGIEPDCTAFLDIFPGMGFTVRGPLTVYDERLTTLLSNPSSNLLAQIGEIQKDMNAYIANSECHNPDDILGLINEIYQPPSYQAFAHSVTSSTKDFTLKYTVSAAP